MAQILRASARGSGETLDLIGPAPCYFERIRGLHHWHLILRGSDPTNWIPEQLPDGWSVDVDPVSLL